MRSTTWGCFLSILSLSAVTAQEARPETVAVSTEERIEETTSEAADPVEADMVVIATRTGKAWLDSAGTVARMSADEIVKTGAQDVGGLIKYDPLLSGPFDFASGDGAFGYGSSGYSGFNIRGVEGNRIAMELDGVRQPPQYVSTSFDMGAESGTGGMGRDYFDPAMFDLVEVMKGGGSALYGSDALGGVVSMRTLSPEDLLRDRDAGGLLRAQYFSANASMAGQVGGAVRQGDFEFMLVAAGREGSETTNNGTLPPNPARFDSMAYLAKAGYRHGEHSFLLTAEAFQRTTDINARTAVISAFPVFDRSVFNSQMMTRERIGIEWSYEPASAWIDSLQTHAYWQSAMTDNVNFSRANDIPIGGIVLPGRRREQTIRFNTDLLGFSSIVRKELDAFGMIHGLMAGIDVSTEEGENRYNREDTNMPWDKDKISFAPSVTDRMGLFLQNEMARGRWTFTPGVRFDYHRINPELSPGYLARLASLTTTAVEPPGPYENATLSPRFDITYKTSENTRLYAAWAQGIRNPSAEELSMIFEHPAAGGNPAGTITVPNPSLEEEKSNSFKAGFKGESDAGRIGFEGFYTFYENYIENGVRTGRVDNLGRDILTTLNRGKAEIYGFEASGEWKMASWNPLFEGWTIGASTGKAVGINRTDDKWLNSVEPWKSVAWIGYDEESQRYGMRMSAVHTAAVKHVDDTTTQGRFFRPPAWTTLDVSAYWRPAEDTLINAGVNNLFDEKYWSWGSVRRGSGHIGGGAMDDRSTAPGVNFYLSVTQTF